MIRKKLLKISLITTVVATLLVSAGCGKKAADNNTIQETKATVSTETKSVAAKELTKTGLVTFEYTDADGTTYTLEGKAVANESGDATIDVTDTEGNKVTFTGKAKTEDGKLSVSDIAVKDAGTLVKSDGSRIEVTTGAIVADASESAEGESNSDIAASDDVKQEVETAQKEESVIEAAREEVTKSEENANDTNNDTVIADNGSNSENINPAPVPNEPKQDVQETPTEPSYEEPKQDTPAAPSEPDVTPVTPEPEKPAPVETPTEAPTEAPTEKATHMETKYIYYHNYDGSIYYTDSVTYLAYEDGTPVEETYYSEGDLLYPDSGDENKFSMCWLINSGGPAKANNEQMFADPINLANYSGNINMYPGYL